MNTDIELHGGLSLDVIAPLDQLSNKISKTDFVPVAMRNRPEAVLACMLTGQEIGVGPMQALRQIYVIEGRPSLSAELMRALVLNAGHEIWFGEGQEFTTSRVVVYGRRNGSDAVTRVEWTMDMARAAGVANKNNWKAHPRAMLSARSTSELCRLTFPDVISGIGYTPEELQENAFEDPYATATEAEIVETAPKAQKRTAPAKKAVAKKATPPRARQQPAPVSNDGPPLPGEEDDVTDAEIVAEDDGALARAAQAAGIPVGATFTDARGQQTTEEKARSREVVRLAKALKIDHHEPVQVITNMVKDSASRLTAQEAAQVMDLLRAMENGRALIRRRDDGGLEAVAPDEDNTASMGDDEAPFEEPEDVVDAEVVEEEETDVEDWDSDVWRDLLKAHNVKVSALIRRVAEITPQGQTPIGNLQSISGSGIAAQLAEWVRAQ